MEAIITVMIMIYFMVTLSFGFMFYYRLQETERNMMTVTALFTVMGERLNELEKPKNNVVQLRRFR